jgi:hypothetical protein
MNVMDILGRVSSRRKTKVAEAKQSHMQRYRTLLSSMIAGSTDHEDELAEIVEELELTDAEMQKDLELLEREPSLLRMAEGEETAKADLKNAGQTIEKLGQEYAAFMSAWNEKNVAAHRMQTNAETRRGQAESAKLKLAEIERRFSPQIETRLAELSNECKTLVSRLRWLENELRGSEPNTLQYAFLVTEQQLKRNPGDRQKQTYLADLSIRKSEFEQELASVKIQLEQLNVVRSQLWQGQMV